MTTSAFCLALCLAASSTLPPQTGDASAGGEPFRSILLEFTRPGLPVPHWSIQLRGDGSGVYSEDGAASSVTQAPTAIMVSAATLSRIAAGLPTVEAQHCETKLKHIAQTGEKKLSFTSDAAASYSCTFNYSDEEKLNTAAETLSSVAATLQAGERLEQKHRFDHLGLDAEIDGLVAASKAGRAIELANIAPILRSIAEDDRLMERVQRKAARLLQDSASPAPVSAR